MSARPALSLVTSRRRPGPRALEFIKWAVDTFGEPAEPGQVVVRLTQTALVAHHDTIDSDGTVTWYMRQLRAAGIVVGTRPITVDLHALAGLARPPGGGEPADPLHSSESPASPVAELLAQRAEQQARLAQLQAELALTDVALARAMTLSETVQAKADPRELANKPVAIRDRFRDLREPGLAGQEGRKEYLDNPPSFLTQGVANRDRGPRLCSRTSDQLASSESVLAFDEIDEILGPLRAWCRREGLMDHLDDQGRAYLAPLGRSQLTAGAARIRAEAENDPTIRKPVGLLIDRARKHHAETFQPPVDLELSPWLPAPTPPDAAPVDLEPRASRPFDDEVIALAASRLGLSTARSSLQNAHDLGATIGQDSKT